MVSAGTDRMLRAWRLDGVSLSDAIRLSQIDHGFALLSSPWRFDFARMVAGGSFQGHDGFINLADAFEARCFNERCELRWVQRSPGLGSAVLLSDEPGVGEAFGGADVSLAADILGEHRYLLWGVSAGPPEEGWTRLDEGRIGSLTVPVAVSRPGARVALRAVEYVATDSHGNAYIAEERLLGLVEEK